MARVTAWTVGLFGSGAAIARALATPWLEPLVLLALGLAFLFVSARMGQRARATVAELPARGAAPAAATAKAAAVPVEQSA